MALSIKNLEKRYNDKIIFNNASIELENGIYALSAPSGTGKTTLFRILCRLEKCDGGSFRYDGSVSVMFQEARLFPWLNAIENVVKAAQCSNERAFTLLRDLELSGEEKKLAHELSGGMQRRVAAARSLAMDAGLYLFDEPLAGLDASLKEKMCTVIRDNIPDNAVALIVSHELDEVKKISRRILILENGIIK